MKPQEKPHAVQDRAEERVACPIFPTKVRKKPSGISRIPPHFGGAQGWRIKLAKAPPKWGGTFGHPNEINDCRSRRREQNPAYVIKPRPAREAVAGLDV
jgi:hypothetical protein